MNKKYHYVYRITNTKLNKHYYGTRSSRIEPSKDLGFKYFSSSSDILFMDDQKNNPHDYKYAIVSVFDSREEALELEVILHAKFDVGVNESFYNKSKQTSKRFYCDRTGAIISEETRKKLSIASKNMVRKPVSDETRKKLSIASKGRILTEEHKANISQAKVGHGTSEETKAKLREAANIQHRKPVSDETRRKISEKAKLRKGRPVSEETKAKLSKALTGRIKSQEERDKIGKSISAALKGKPLPVATEPCKYCGKIMAKSHMSRWHGEKCKLK